MKQRKPIARVGRRAKRDRGAIDRCRRAVLQRSGGRCEATGIIDPICGYAPHSGVAMHHMWPEDRDRGRHEPERCRWLCDASHAWVHAHPNKAKELGLLRPDLA